MTDRELLQMALDALEYPGSSWPDARQKIAEALRARLAQPEQEQEPVAWHEPGAYGNVTVHKAWARENGWLPLYTAPPQRKWQGLTDKEIDEVFGSPMKLEPSFMLGFVRAIEAKLKEKNS